ncbi:endonuclease/exonuclease/phosphatase family protein [Actinocatenispora rupis]|uniref:Metal-dependent hydrolase n=1 Tax=Actinocatenispora rupis TaxID=519421 RepID=A0A8J3NBP1_9ACTN|nr:endonuclease/exonuclease/phosphatase family protein [Actinocatenispora rupis]GID09554.1 metal-dependent hydrolase [Actinocatenispora rupis]
MSDTLRVLTFNIRHGAGTDDVLDLARTAEAVAAADADVTGLQEVDRHFDARSRYVDQPAWLGRRLGQRDLFGADLDLDPPSADTPRRQYGSALLSRLPVLAHGYHALPSGRRERFGLLWATVEFAGTPVTVATTHLDPWQPEVRLAQATAVRDLLAAHPEPTVLLGDLNARPGTPEIAVLAAGRTDVWVAAGTGDGHTFDSTGPYERIDYVLVDAAWRVVSADVPATGTVSDHLPVRATLRLG